MVVTGTWIGDGSDKTPWEVKLPKQYQGKGYKLLPNQPDPKAGAKVKVELVE